MSGISRDRMRALKRVGCAPSGRRIAGHTDSGWSYASDGTGLVAFRAVGPRDGSALDAAITAPYLEIPPSRWCRANELREWAAKGGTGRVLGLNVNRARLSSLLIGVRYQWIGVGVGHVPNLGPLVLGREDWRIVLAGTLVPGRSAFGALYPIKEQA